MLLELQNKLEGIIPVSGLLAIMSMGIVINQKYNVLAKRLSVKYNKLWLGAEIFLFVLVGIAVDFRYALAAGAVVVLLVVLALMFRMSGVAMSLMKTDLNKNERVFCAIAYTPKATVQAAYSLTTETAENSPRNGWMPPSGGFCPSNRHTAF